VSSASVDKMAAEKDAKKMKLVCDILPFEIVLS